MASKKEYLWIAVGSVLAFSGGLQMLRNVDATSQLFLWGIVVLLGVLVLLRGILAVLTATDREATVDPDDAVEKTDSRFGRR